MSIQLRCHLLKEGELPFSRGSPHYFKINTTYQSYLQGYSMDTVSITPVPQRRQTSYQLLR
jgi:hypothetical protein